MKKVQPYERISLSKKEIMINNLLGGIAWGVGATIGLAVILALISLIMQYIDLVPVIGPFVTEVYEYVVENSSRLSS
jgi:hypothetical protein